ncbi:unnamed protein product [Rotaria sp. Silwood1]|nr:unnamed protein product [Rotaria sp. Silwood1]CAF1640519.1 unnamed protein product [Rotaria sp. Silwood1]
MLKTILIVIISLGLQVVNGNLELALQSFLASAKAKTSSQNNYDDVRNLYELYKIQFKRDLKAKSDDDLRFKAFNMRLNEILDHSRQGNKSYALGLNDHSDWTEDEWRILQRGARLPKGNFSHMSMKSSDRLLTWQGKLLEGVMSVPASYDLTRMVVSGTNVPVVLQIKNQGQCGSCYSFAFICLLEFQYAIQLKQSASLSEQQIVDCSTGDHGCNGGWISSSFGYLQNNQWQVNGAPYYPYRASQGSCAFRSSGGGGVKFGRLGYWNAMKSSSTAAADMQQALVSYGPLYVALFVGNDNYRSVSTVFQGYKSGIIDINGCPSSSYSINHAVVIIGYGVDSATGIPYWKVRNSWGTWWGENGYFRIRRGVNMCAIESVPFFIAQPA